MLILSFAHTDGLDFSNISFSLTNFKEIIDPVYFDAYANSIILSFLASLICLLLAYPIALTITKFKNNKLKNIILIMFILPMWSNMLLRIIGWETLFQPNSILNYFDISLNLIGSPIAVVIGMVSTYLPFMIFPIYTVLNKIDPAVIEASYDLGATKTQTLRRVIFPLSLPGIYSGITMTFLPSATNFALPERLSAGKINLLGNLINSNFGKTFDYGFGSLLSVILITIIFILTIFINRKDKDGDLLL
jgi:spermidine/putrescine transport system permease protein